MPETIVAAYQSIPLDQIRTYMTPKKAKKELGNIIKESGTPMNGLTPTQAFA